MSHLYDYLIQKINEIEKTKQELLDKFQPELNRIEKTKQELDYELEEIKKIKKKKELSENEKIKEINNSEFNNLIEKIKEHRNVRDITLNTYIRHLNKLSIKIEGHSFKNNNFLISKKKQILEYINTLSESVSKNYLASILVAISPERKNPPKKYRSVYEEYNDLLKTQHQKYNERINSHDKNNKEEKNWLQWCEILNLQQKMGDELKNKNFIKHRNDIRFLQKYVIISLYTLHPPRRLEYADTEIISFNNFNQMNDIDKNNKVLLVVISDNKKFFSFGKNVVKSLTLKTVQIDIKNNLNHILNIWLNINNSKYLLLNSNGDKLTKNGLSKILRSIFMEYTDKKISVSMLRKIKISSEFDPNISDKQTKLSNMMNHSVKVQQSVYLKHK